MTRDTRIAAITLAAACAFAVAVVLAAGAVFGWAATLPALAVLGDAGAETVFTLALFGALVVVAVVGARTEGRRIAPGPDAARRAGAGLALGIGGLATATLLAAIAGVAHRAAGGGGVGAAILVGLPVVAFQASAEEIYFRGWLQPALVRAWGPAAGIGVTALAFAALHIAGGARTPLTLVNLVVAGLVFGTVAWRTGGIAAACGLHAGWNATEALVFGLDPNPGVGGFGALVDLDLVGRAIWGGSEEGLNASVAVTVVLAAILLPLVVGRGRAATIRPAASG